MAKKHPWVKKAPYDSEMAYCSSFRVNVQPRLSSLKNHKATSKHIKASPSVSRTKRILTACPKECAEKKPIEIKFAVAISCNSAKTSIDNLGELITIYRAGSQLEKMKLHCTKYAYLIQNVISPEFYDDLYNDMEGERYCATMDKSTDVAYVKCLCITVHYYSKMEHNIVTSLLCLIQVTHATREAIFRAMKGCLEASKLKLPDCIGFASAGA